MITARVWSRRDPYVCACAGVYRPVLSPAGKLVKTREPAWRMMEQTRDPDCLQEHCRALSKIYRLGYQHHKDSRGSGGGYPDVHMWTCLRPGGGGGSVHAELKRMDRDPSTEQIRVMAELQDAGNLVYLIRPCCLLTGAVDDLMAALAGRPNLNVRAGPAHTPVEVPDGAPIPRSQADALAGVPVAARAAAAGVAALTDPVRRAQPMFRRRPLPGRVPCPFTPAVGYVIPSPGGQARTADEPEQLEAWLRGAGFSPVDVPYPIRLIVGRGLVHVHCRLGLARPGVDERVWREGTTVTEFPARVAGPLRAHVIRGASSTIVAETMLAATAAAPV